MGFGDLAVGLTGGVEDLVFLNPPIPPLREASLFTGWGRHITGWGEPNWTNCEGGAKLDDP